MWFKIRVRKYIMDYGGIGKFAIPLILLQNVPWQFQLQKIHGISFWTTIVPSGESNLFQSIVLIRA